MSRWPKISIGIFILGFVLPMADCLFYKLQTPGGYDAEIAGCWIAGLFLLIGGIPFLIFLVLELALRIAITMRPDDVD